MKPRALAVSVGLGIVVAGHAGAAPVKRKAVDILGDFAMVGNTFAHNCGDKAPVVGTVTSCTDTFTDASPDVYWQAEATTATAGPLVTPAASRTTAMLSMPSGARVEYATLYWFGTAAAADKDCTFERPGGPSTSVTADSSYQGVASNPAAVKPANKTLTQFLSGADVTDFVAAQGSGAYRVSGVDGPALDDNHGAAERGWALVVFYEAPGAAPHNLVLFEGIDGILGGTVSVPLSGFKVPTVFSGKLGIVGIDGEVAGASLRFGVPPLGAGNLLSDALNPSTFFFNGTRSWLGQPVSVAGDLPQASGQAGSFGGIDMDVVDVTAQLKAGQTSAEAQISAGPGDGIINFIWVTSVTTLAPVLTAAKKVKDENGGAVVPGDILEYSVTVTNKGNDPSADTVFEDTLSSGLEFVAGSLKVSSGSATTTLTDATGDDAGEYTGASKKLVVRLGTGASATQGGSVAPSESVTVTFRAKVAAGTEGTTLANQAAVTAKGQSGAAAATIQSDDPDKTGITSTDVTVASGTDGGSGGAPSGGSGGGAGAAGSGATAGTGGGSSTGGSSTGGSSSGGSGGSAGGAASDSGDDGGCGCRTAPVSSGAASALAALAALAALSRRRRGTTER